MFKIKKLSSTGFQLEDSTGVHWFTVDSFKILKSKTFNPSFESLKEGDLIDNLKFKEGKDGKNYVINFDLISPSVPIVLGKNLERGEVKPPTSDLNSTQSVTSSVQDKIIYGQCVNIAFNNLTHNDSYLDYLSTDGEYVNIKKAFNLADKIYEEYTKRVKL